MKRTRYYEDDFEGFIHELIDSGRLEAKEVGIAKYMLDNGYNSLSQKQAFVFDRMIDNNTIERCKRCDMDIPWCEMFDALDNGGYCNYCKHMMEKMDEE